MRLVLGLIKGTIIGGLVGFGSYQLFGAGRLEWMACGVVGALVGLLVGRPIWSHLRDKDSTIVVALLKAAFGFGIGLGLWALANKFIHVQVPLYGIDQSGATRPIAEWQPLIGVLVGGLYGAFVEADDAPSGDAKDKDKSKKK